MEIQYKNDKDRDFWNDQKELTKKYGKEMACIITQRLVEIVAAETLGEMPPASETHPLDGNRKGQISIKLKQPYRLIIAPIDEINLQDVKIVECIRIIEVINYH